MDAEAGTRVQSPNTSIQTKKAAVEGSLFAQSPRIYFRFSRNPDRLVVLAHRALELR